MSTQAINGNPCRVVTGVCRASYCHLNEPKAVEGGTPKYSVSIIIDKSDTETVNKINAAIKAAYNEGINKLKGNSKTAPPLSAIKNPLRDGDAEREGDETYSNSYFLNANSIEKPAVLDLNRRPITDTSELYSGIYCRFSINFYTFNVNGNKGIAAGLNGVQKVRDGARLGGRGDVSADFDDGYTYESTDEDFLM